MFPKFLHILLNISIKFPHSFSEITPLQLRQLVPKFNQLLISLQNSCKVFLGLIQNFPGISSEFYKKQYVPAIFLIFLSKFSEVFSKFFLHSATFIFPNFFNIFLPSFVKIFSKSQMFFQNFTKISILQINVF